MATAAQVEEFREQLDALSVLALRDLRAVWSALDLSDAIAVAEGLKLVLPDLVEAYGSTAALVGADFYDMLREVAPSPERFRAVMARPAAEGLAVAAAAWSVGPMFSANPDPNQAFINLSGAVQRLVAKPGRETVSLSAERDPVKPLWARIPGHGGAKCKFCLEMASKGAAHGTGDRDAYHSHCRCMPVPVWSPKDLPEGYDPAALAVLASQATH